MGKQIERFTPCPEQSAKLVIDFIYGGAYALFAYYRNDGDLARDQTIFYRVPYKTPAPEPEVLVTFVDKLREQEVMYSRAQSGSLYDNSLFQVVLQNRDAIRQSSVTSQELLPFALCLEQMYCFCLINDLFPEG